MLSVGTPGSRLLGGSIYAKLSCLEGLLEVLLRSLALFPVAFWGNDYSGELTCHHKFCASQPPSIITD